MADIFIARQPIYDQGLGVFGYELLYRCSEVNAAGNTAGDLATSNVILNAFVEMDLQRLVGSHRAFINFPASLLLSGLPLQLPEERVVLEVLEDVEVTAPIIAAVRHLSERGFHIALDDFVYDSSLRPLLEMADIVKFDLLALSPEELKDQVARVRGYNVKLVAEKLETAEQFELCKELGFDYFQGYHFARPHLIKGQRLPDDRMIVLRMLAELQSPDVEASRLEALVTRDVSLSYKLMRLINSAYFYRRHQIHSIHHAIVFLGNRAIKSWLSLIAMSGIEQKPSELTTIALTRAKMCELLAGSLGQKSTEGHFTAGLFSVLEVLMDLPMEEIAESLPLDADLLHALLHGEGPYGAVLACTLAYERGEWDDPACRLVSPDDLSEAYVSAVAWADQAHEELERAA